MTGVCLLAAHSALLGETLMMGANPPQFSPGAQWPPPSPPYRVVDTSQVHRLATFMRGATCPKSKAGDPHIKLVGYALLEGVQDHGKTATVDQYQLKCTTCSEKWRRNETVK